MTAKNEKGIDWRKVAPGKIDMKVWDDCPLKPVDVVSSEDFIEIVENVAQKVCPRKDMDNVAPALIEFTDALLHNNPVQAVAFLSARQPNCPVTLSIQVILPLQPQNETSDTALKAVIAAGGVFAKRTLNILPVELQPIDSAGQDLNVLQRQLQNRWAKDPDLELLAVLNFPPR